MEIVKPFKFLIIGTKNISDINTLSGTPYFIQKAIKEYVGEVEIIDRLTPEAGSFYGIISNLDYFWRYLLLKARTVFFKIFFKKRYEWKRSILLSKYYVKSIMRKAKNTNYDFILSDKGSIELAYLDTNIPLILLSDTTFRLMLDFYPGFSNLSFSSIKEGNLIEQKAIDKASLCIYRSEWAANSAVNDYHAAGDKVKVIYPGPNIESSFLPSYEEILNKNITDECNLLLVGVEWHRKGCDIAVRTVEKLIEAGINARLTVCGCKPPSGVKLGNYVTVIPSLNKNKKEEFAKIISLYKKATYFVLPTRAETLGISFVEACAFGLPICATNVGGTPEIVRNSVNGFIFSLEDDGEKYADRIAGNFKDRSAYKEMSLNSYRIYSDECNWRHWADNLRELLEKLDTKEKVIT